MRRILFTLPVPGTGGVPVSSYGVALVLSFIVGVWLGLCWARARGLTRYVIEWGTISLIGALIGARALYVIQFWDAQFAGRPWWSVFALRHGGLSFYGGFLGAAVFSAAAFLVRRIDPRGPEVREALDIIAPLLALILALARIGCYLNGCCHGAICPRDHALAAEFPRETPAYSRHLQAGLITPGAAASLPVYCTQLLSAAFDFLLFAGLTLLLWKRPEEWRGAVLLAFCLIYPLFRFSVEFLRDDAGHWLGLTLGQLMSVALFTPAAVIGIVWWARGGASA